MRHALLTFAAGIVLTAATPLLNADEPKTVTARERLDVLKRSRVWHRTHVAAMDMRVGPPAGAFRAGATVTCKYVDKKFGGRTPKFACARTPNDVVKVRYGRDNGEIYAGVAATRLLWALGFGADGLYPVRVVCRGCPGELEAEATPLKHALVFDIAAIERPFAGVDVETRGAGEGWSWQELDLVDQSAGGATVAERDALKLLAVLLQHSDNKPEQQRLVCLDGGTSRKALSACAEPFMMIHDVGVTFGRANLRNRGDVGSANFDEWSKTPIWKIPEHCVANLAASQTGTLDDPVISEGGRKFLADLLRQLTDRQLRDLFTVARVATKPTGGAPVASWVEAFKHKRDEISAIRCR